MSLKKWIIKFTLNDKISEFLEKQDFKPLLKRLLASRGLTNKEILNDFIKEEEDFPDVSYFKDMQKAIDRIKTALKNKELICIFGDYDADGVISTAIMFSFLRKRKANVMYYIPSREDEGYGMNKKAIVDLAELGVNLIITVDNGIAAKKEIKLASSFNIDTVIIDHHSVPKDPPKAFAIINPYQKDCKSEFKDFCGAGLVFLTVLNFDKDKKNIDKYLQFAAIATIADVVPLINYNKKLVNLGLKCIADTDIPGILALKKESSLEFKKISSTDVAFLIAPKINACGRISSPEIALKLLLCKDFCKACFLAKELTRQNSKRKEIESEISRNSFDFISKNNYIELQSVIVIAAENLHVGVIGIVASKLVEKYSKPCIVLNVENDIAKGSGRSIHGFSLINAIKYCDDLLIKYGGHPMAVGLELKVGNVANFIKKINNFSKEKLESKISFLEIDCEITQDFLSLDQVKQISMLEPFGNSNEPPIFCIKNIKILNIIPIGASKHLKINFEKNISALLFNVAYKDFEYEINEVVDIAFSLSVSEFRGRENVSIFIKDLKFSKIDEEAILLSKKEYEKLKYNFYLKKSIKNCDFIPSRNDFALVYKYLKQAQNSNFYSKETIYYKANFDSINFSKFMLILDILEELNLIFYKFYKNMINIQINKKNKKANLETSNILIFLKERTLK